MLSSTVRRQAAVATSAFPDVRDQVVRDQSNGFTNILG